MQLSKVEPETVAAEIRKALTELSEQGSLSRLAIDGRVINFNYETYYNNDRPQREAVASEIADYVAQDLEVSMGSATHVFLNVGDAYWQARHFQKKNGIFICIDIRQKYQFQIEANQAFRALLLTEPNHFSVPWLLSHFAGSKIDFRFEDGHICSETEYEIDQYSSLCQATRLVSQRSVNLRNMSALSYSFDDSDWERIARHGAFRDVAELGCCTEPVGALGPNVLFRIKELVQ